MAGRWGNSGSLWFLGSKITADGNCSHEIKRHLLLGRKVLTNIDSILKSRDITLPTKVHRVEATIESRFFQWSCINVRLDYKESWALKNWCFWTVVLEKTFESPLDCKEIQSVHLKGLNFSAKISFMPFGLECWKVKVKVSQLVQLCVIWWIIQSTEFSRPEYKSG